jgi:hypothetical protein
MKPANVLINELKQFTGSDTVYKHWLGGMKYSQGVKHLAEHGGANGAFWLLDVIASHQPEAMRDPMLREIQFWKVKVDVEKHSCVVACHRDGDDVAITQAIEFTDLQLPEVSIWVANRVMYLPSEH